MRDEYVRYIMERYPTPNLEERASVLGRRFEALLIDGLLVVVLVAVVSYLLGTTLLGGRFGGLGATIVGVQFGAPLLLLGYQTGMEGYYGQTLGKRLRGIVVVREDGTDLSWGGALVRNLLRIVDALPVFYVLGIVTAYLTDDHQRVGDLAGSTVVVRTA